jgi:LysM repeat protein
MARASSKLDLEPRHRRWRDFRPSVWTFVAPVALVACAFVIASIASDAGWTHRGHAKAPTRTTGAARTTEPGAAILYRAKRGDTLTVVAVRFGIAVDRLRTLNPKVPADGSLPVGRRIRLR